MKISPAVGDYLPIRQAAKTVHMSRQKVRAFVEDGSVRARKIGQCKDGSPWLTVHMVDLQQAIDKAQIYVPKGLEGKRKPNTRKPKEEILHPSCASMV